MAREGDLLMVKKSFVGEGEVKKSTDRLGHCSVVWVSRARQKFGRIICHFVKFVTLEIQRLIVSLEVNRIPGSSKAYRYRS